MHKVLITFLATVLLSSFAVAQKRMTDAEDYGLKGKVQEISRERATVEWKDGKWKATVRTVSGVSTYDPNGRHLAYRSYSFGMASSTVYLEVDGVPAMKSQVTEDGSAPPPPMPLPTRKDAPKPDPRYDIKYLNTRDEKGRLKEKVLVSNDGRILSLLTYKYDESGNQIESATWTEFDEVKQMNRRVFPPRKLDALPQRTVDVEGRKLLMVRNSLYVYKYDAEGRQTDWMLVGDDGKVKEHNRFAQYEIDASKNWTKRVVFVVEMKDGKEELTPRAIEYQVIKYHP
ncbi:MAG: hypothetical protein SF097_04560 [Acidobacteriota bacterium]|nr:hypothetical protein [Acidobacteriota bacterium]